MTGIEPVTSALPMRRTTDCATSARWQPIFQIAKFIVPNHKCAVNLFRDFFVAEVCLGRYNKEDIEIITKEAPYEKDADRSRYAE